MHPLSASVIKAEKLKTAIPFIPSSESIHPDPTVTPVRKRVESFFVQFFERKAEDRKARAKGRIQPKHYGEALTEDEVFERIK